MNALYYVNVDSQLNKSVFNSMLDFVSPEKKNKVLKFRFDIDRKLSLYSEILVRCLICKTLSITNKDIEIQQDELGKPFLKNNPSLHFNLSHTKNAITVGISNDPLGVDIEKIKAADMKIAERFFTDNELSWIRSNNSEQDVNFFSIWTKKEAALKSEGKGISHIKSFDVTDSYLLDHLSTIRIDDYLISVCSKDKFIEDDLIRLTEAELIEMWHINESK